MVPQVFHRTVGGQKALASQYQHNQNVPDSKTKHPSQFYSTVHTPCLVGNDLTKILDLFPPPELHIHTGITQHVIREIDEKWGPKDSHQMLQWLSDHDIKQIKFTYNGNACRDFLNFKLEALKNDLPPELHKYVTVLEKFKLVKDACFSDYLAPNYKDCIAEFKAAFESCMDEFPKSHILLTHVPEFCDKYQRGLGKFSEQTSEAVHSGYKEVYKNFKMFPDGHLRAVIKYNVQNI